MEKLHSRFDDVYQVLNFYALSSPVGIKSNSIFNEMESDVESQVFRGSRPKFGTVPFAGDTKEDIYASTVHALVYTFKVHSDPRMKQAFCLFYLFTPKNRGRLSKDEIAEILGVSKKKVTHYLNSILLTLERELIRRELISPELFFT